MRASPVTISRCLNAARHALRKTEITVPSRPGSCFPKQKWFPHQTLSLLGWAMKTQKNPWFSPIFIQLVDYQRQEAGDLHFGPVSNADVCLASVQGTPGNSLSQLC